MAVWVNYEVHWPYKRQTSFRCSTEIFYADGDYIEMFYDEFNCAKYARGIVNFDNRQEAEFWARHDLDELIDNDSCLNSEFWCQPRSDQVPAQDATKVQPSHIQPRAQARFNQGDKGPNDGKSRKSKMKNEKPITKHKK